MAHPPAKRRRSPSPRTYTLSVTAPGFHPVTYGYDQPETKAVTITVTYNGGATATDTVTFTVAGAPQDAPATPELEQKTYNSVALKEIAPNANGAVAQYSEDGGEIWQDSREFAGLSAIAAYTFTVRYNEVGSFAASPVSVPLSVTTNAAPSSGGGYTPSNRPSAKVDGAGGTVKTGSGTVTITPDEGYRIAKVTVNGKEVSVPEDGKLTGLKRTDKVVVTFGKIPEKPTVDRSKYDDLDAGAWYFEAVRYVVEHGLFAGASDTMFSPNATMIRAMLMRYFKNAAN